MRILVTDNLSPRGVEVLRGAPEVEVDVQPTRPPEELARAIGAYDALIIRSATKVTPQVLAAPGRLKVVGRAGVGVDNVDVEAATGRGIVVMNTPSGNTITVAEHTFGLLLALAKNIPQATASMKAGRWEKSTFLSVELSHKALGVLGLGRVGAEVARRARAFGMQVLAYDPFISAEAAGALGVELVELADLYRRADFITVHVPLTPETTNLIDARAIAQMKDGVRVVNAARGGIVDEAALGAALQAGKVAGAALDVFEREPPAGSPLLPLSNVICTPHLGASSEEAQEHVAVEVAQQVLDYLLRGIIRNAVNAPSLPPELFRRIEPYLVLGERLGSLAAQLAEGRTAHVRIHYGGEIAGVDSAPLSVSVVKGVLEAILQSEGTVNAVNALRVARERGIRITDSRSSEETDFASLITVSLATDRGETTVAGTLFNRREPRLVRIDEFRLEAPPEGYMLVFSNMDVPGVIGRIGTILGRHQVNIAGMHLGRQRPGGRAVSIVNVDSAIPGPVLDEIRRMPDIVYAKLVRA
jgi:D-3-phosphoglycerate dehydrogenase